MDVNTSTKAPSEPPTSGNDVGQAEYRKNGLLSLIGGTVALVAFIALAFALDWRPDRRFMLVVIPIVGIMLRGLYFLVWGKALPDDPTGGTATIKGSGARITVALVFLIALAAGLGWIWIKLSV